jgi:Transcriptional regulators
MASDAALRLSTVSVVEALVASLRDRVLDGEITPGSPLAETELAFEYGVSRPTARSAVAALVHEGLLHRQANKPAVVPRLTGADIGDIFLVRMPLELEVLHLLLVRGTVPTTEAARAVADLAQMPPDAPHSAFVEADLRFHQTLVDAVGSPRLSRLYRTIRGELHLCMVQTSRTLGRDRIAREHLAVLEALRAGRGEQAARCMRDHLEGATLSLQEIFSDATV